MNRFALKLIAVLTSMLLTACAGLAGNDIPVSSVGKSHVAVSKVKSLATVRVASYADARNTGNPRMVGMSQVRVMGLSGTELVLDQTVSDLVTDAMQRSLNATPITVVPANDAGALFELGGVIKELRFDARDRDYVSIKVQTTLTELATGKVLWSGEVVQSENRFAGVSGDSRGDIAEYLVQQLSIVSRKTADAVNDILQATRPDLFNLTPGARVVPGVKVLVAPEVVAPAVPAPLPVLAAPASAPQAVTTGVLMLTTVPARAAIHVDGVYYGLSPMNITLDPGVHEVVVRRAGYRAVTEKVSVRKNDTTELDLTLEP